MIYELPIFPLNTVLFPGMPLQLHIFEERYKVMLQDVLQSNQMFGVCLIKSGAEALGPLAEPYLTGCTARIMHVEPLEDERVDLTAVGDARFRIIKTGNAYPYLKAFVESDPLTSHQTPGVAASARNLRQQLASYLNLLSRFAEQETTLEQTGQDREPTLDLDLSSMQLPEDPMMLMYLAAALLQIPASEKQPLLEASTAPELLQKVQRIYRRELAILPPQLDITPAQARAAAQVN